MTLPVLVVPVHYRPLVDVPITRQGDTWGPREIVAHLAGWEIMATVRVPHIVSGMPPLEFAGETSHCQEHRQVLILSHP